MSTRGPQRDVSHVCHSACSRENGCTHREREVSCDGSVSLVGDDKGLSCPGCPYGCKLVFLSLGTTKGCLALAALMVVSSLLFAITVRPYYERMREKDEFYSLYV